MSAFPGEEAGTPAVIRGLRLALAVLVALGVTLLLLPVQLPAMAFKWPVARRIPQLWYRLVLPFLGIRVSVQGTFLKARPLLVVANGLMCSFVLHLVGFSLARAGMPGFDEAHWEGRTGWRKPMLFGISNALVFVSLAQALAARRVTPTGATAV